MELPQSVVLISHVKGRNTNANAEPQSRGDAEKIIKVRSRICKIRTSYPDHLAILLFFSLSRSGKCSEKF
jgi:hypothetical protein